MSKVYMMVGNIGSGKSTAINDGSTDCVICPDVLREQFGEMAGEKYLWDETLEEFIHDIMLDSFEACLHIGVKEIFLDETFMDKAERAPWIALANKYGYEVEALVFTDLGKEEHIRRRMTNHRNFSQELWEQVYDNNKTRYELPTIEEGFTEIVMQGE